MITFSWVATNGRKGKSCVMKTFILSANLILSKPNLSTVLTSHYQRNIEKSASFFQLLQGMLHIGLFFAIQIYMVDYIFSSYTLRPLMCKPFMSCNIQNGMLNGCP